MPSKPPAGAPYAPAPYELADVHALKALAGDEDVPAHQARRALNWIIHSACGTYDQSYRPGEDGDRDTAFAEGRRFVGNQIVKLVNLSPEIMTRMRKNDARRAKPGTEQPS